MQGEAAGLAGDASGQGEEAPPQGFGGRHQLAQTDARGPAAQVVGHYLYGRPSGVGLEAARRKMVELHAVLEIADGVLDLGVAEMVGFQGLGVPVPVGYEGVVTVSGKPRQLGAGVGLNRRTMSRTAVASGSCWKGVYSVSATSAAPSIQYGMGVQSASGMASMMFRKLACWRTVME